LRGRKTMAGCRPSRSCNLVGLLALSRVSPKPTMHEIAAITGHTSLSEVQRCTKAADQKRLALSAMERAK
jgi:hypothetical protein